MAKYKVTTDGGTYMIETEDAPAGPSPDSRSGAKVALDQTVGNLEGIPQFFAGLPKAAAGLLSLATNPSPKNIMESASGMYEGAKQTFGPLANDTMNLANILMNRRSNRAQSSPEQQRAYANASGQNATGVALAKLVPALADKLPSTTRAGANLATVMDAAKDVPIDTTQAGNAAIRADQLAQTGSSLPKVLRDYMKYPANTPMTYETGRDFASNAGSLSASEKMATNPQMGRQVAKFADAMKTANRDAAASVGMGDLYDSAMKEYAQAKLIGNAGEVLKKWAAKAGIVAALGGAGKAGYDIYGKVMH